MKKQATKTIVLSIMRTQKEWKPYEVVRALKIRYDIYVSESTITRQFRRWPEIQSIEPRDRAKCATWTYKVIA